MSTINKNSSKRCLSLTVHESLAYSPLTRSQKGNYVLVHTTDKHPIGAKTLYSYFFLSSVLVMNLTSLNTKQAAMLLEIFNESS